MFFSQKKGVILARRNADVVCREMIVFLQINANLKRVYRYCLGEHTSLVTTRRNAVLKPDVARGLRLCLFFLLLSLLPVDGLLCLGLKINFVAPRL
jgi:hypothetical protein